MSYKYLAPMLFCKTDDFNVISLISINEGLTELCPGYFFYQFQRSLERISKLLGAISTKGGFKYRQEAAFEYVLGMI